MKYKNKPTADLFDGFSQFVERSMAEWGVPGLAVGVVTDDKIIFREGFGYRDVEKNLAVTTKTLFAIGSCTKSFTAMAVGILVDEGKLEWNKPVIEYMPEFRLYDRYATPRVTPCDLLCHRTGMPRYDIFLLLSPLTRQKVCEGLRYLEPNAGFRELFQYNNLMYVVAGVLVERVSGCTWEEFVYKRIFNPLGMENSNFSVTNSQYTDDYAQPYAEVEGKTAKISFRNIDWAGPAGSINSNLEEMSLWLLANLEGGKTGNKRLISETTLSRLYEPHMAINPNSNFSCSQLMQPMVSGMGWFISHHRGHHMIMTGGDIDGFSALVSFLPQEKTGVVVLTNKFSMLPHTVTAKIYDRLLGLEDFDWNTHFRELFQKCAGACNPGAGKKDVKPKANTQPSLPLDDYKGTYAHPAFDRIQLTTHDGQLVGTLSGINFELEHFHFDIFRIKNSPLKGLKVTFSLSVDGEVKSLSVPLEASVSDIVFQRIGNFLPK
jgi:CubicO group peptidase (beta-lactamase class C family)